MLTSAQSELVRSLPRDTLLALNRAIVNRIKHMNDIQNYEAKNRYSLGDLVKFTASRTGERHSGTVVGIGPKNMKVLVKGILGRSTKWTVPPVILSRGESHA